MNETWEDEDMGSAKDYPGPCEDAPCCGCCGTDPYEGEYDNPTDDYEFWGEDEF